MWKIMFSKNLKKTDDNETRNLVAKYARGNVNLQNGCYVTKEEKEALKKEVLNHKFA